MQVGAFQSRAKADRLAAELTAERLPVEVASVLAGGTGGATAMCTARHELLVTGSSADAVNAALRGAGKAQPVGGGAVVRPALELKDAVALSKRLAAEGMTVKIRRVDTAGGPAPRTPTALHAVRVGGYPDREEAEAARRSLEGKGVRGFITQGQTR
ncbi:MAG: SPOR domain-containing protein [Candidatus Rokubacteria bacterium]|nr:SPOR domain-containing protein [Candidatus Rokubacteria bacterium]